MSDQIQKLIEGTVDTVTFRAIHYTNDLFRDHVGLEPTLTISQIEVTASITTQTGRRELAIQCFCFRQMKEVTVSITTSREREGRVELRVICLEGSCTPLVLSSRITPISLKSTPGGTIHYGGI